jgi:hypothetical protein
MTPVELDRLAAAVPPEVAEVELVLALREAARSDWRCSAWVLERRWPERWALAERTTEPGEDEHEFDWEPDVA